MERPHSTSPTLRRAPRLLGRWCGCVAVVAFAVACLEEPEWQAVWTPDSGESACEFLAQHGGEPFGPPRLHEWDENGVPTPETLKALGLDPSELESFTHQRNKIVPGFHR